MPRPDGDLDGRLLAALVRHHRIGALLGPALAPEAALPDAVADPLRRVCRKAIARSLDIQAETARVALAFRDRGLDLLVLKGAAFAAGFYGDAGMRVPRDIDLLVRPRDREPALGLLQGLGYRQPQRQLGEGTTVGLAQASGVLVELHVGLGEEPGILAPRDLDPFETAMTVTVAGTAVRTLGPEAAVVYAAHHAAKHYWRRLIWLEDLAAAATSGRMDWPAAVTLARRCGVEVHLTLGLLLAHRVLGAPMPPALAGDGRLLAAAERSMPVAWRVLNIPFVATDQEAVRHIGRLRALRWEVGLHRRMAGRIGVLRYRLRPTVMDAAVVELPPHLAWLYLPVRIVRVLLGEVCPRFGRRPS